MWILWHNLGKRMCIWMNGYPSFLLLTFNTLYGMLTRWFNVNTFISEKINWLEWINKEQAMAPIEYCDRNSKGSRWQKLHLFSESLKAIYIVV